MTLSSDQADLLIAIAALYDGDELLFRRTMGPRGERVEHPEKEGEVQIKQGQLLDLADLGLLAFREAANTGGWVRVTSEGRAKVAELQEVEAAQRSGPRAPADVRAMALDWETQVLPVLKATMDANETAGNKGIMLKSINAELGRDEVDPQTERIIDKLVDADYLRDGLNHSGGRLSIDVGPKALELLAGWPTDRPEVAFGRLIELLEERIDATDDPVDKKGLRTMLDSVKNVGEAVASRLITEAVIGGGV